MTQGARNLGKARIVLVHDWLTGMRGGEKCLEALCRRWPEAPLFTLFHVPGSVSPMIETCPITTSFLNDWPGISRYYRFLLPVMPLAVNRLRIPKADLVVSLSHCVAKAVRVPAGTPHICYCFTPMRYIWHLQEAYLKSRSTWSRLPLEPLLAWLRHWDRATARGVTHFVAISETVRKRIAECYGRESVVIYPPVDTDFYCPARVKRDEYYLVVSALVPYKRIDLAIKACNQLKKHLLIIGRGPEAKRLRALAGPTVQFAGWQPDDVVRDHLRKCRALLFPGEEDFGIVPVEAMACGTPVIAYGQGGATETIIPPTSAHEPTGLFFAEQTSEALAEAISGFEQQAEAFSPQACRRQALRFRRQRFEEELFGYLDQVAGLVSAPKLRRIAA
ncbi:MAG: glycosyltransferase [Gemmatales bacterium]|nr:glycosyltransferase [Gemmatales bacterium]MDW8388053.1 glycosyltransferase [Gemmatales bacterium]